MYLGRGHECFGGRRRVLGRGLRREGSDGATRLGGDRGLAASDNVERVVRDADKPRHVVLIRVYVPRASVVGGNRHDMHGLETGLGGVGVVRWLAVAGLQRRTERNVTVQSDPSARARSPLPFALLFACSAPSDLRHARWFVWGSSTAGPQGKRAKECILHEFSVHKWYILLRYIVIITTFECLLICASFNLFERNDSRSPQKITRKLLLFKKFKVLSTARMVR